MQAPIGKEFTPADLGDGTAADGAYVRYPAEDLLDVERIDAIEEKPVVRDGEISTAHLMAVTLACDHRILYGAEGAKFSLSEVKLGLVPAVISPYVTAAIGPVKAKFKGKLQLENLQPPTSYTLRFEGQGGAAGQASHTAQPSTLIRAKLQESVAICRLERK
mgnify:CR=1 FL=1